jgi:NAD(P)-dependent dehydrogenase (short-subunit alcohol dehydrogenase family)
MSLPTNVRAVVTGAGSGIGRAFCREVARRRGSVLCADINLAAAEETAKLVEASGGVGIATKCDVAKLEDIERLAAEADARLGGTDLVINNAGVAVSGEVGEVSIEDWRWLIDINLWGVIYGCHVFVPKFKKAGHGHVINVASAAGIVSGARMGPYNVSKAGVISISETLAGELHGTGCGVTVLCPTFIQTNIMNASRGGNATDRKIVQKLMDAGKFTADDVAALTVGAADRNELYVVPQQDAKWLWRLKRANPARFYDTIIPRGMRAMSNAEGPDVKGFVKGLFRGVFD